MAGKVICSKCGQENDAGETFCGSCGAFLEWSGEQVAASDADSARPPGSMPGSADRPAGLPPDPPPAFRPSAAEPPPVAPVRAGPSRRSVPPGPLDVPGAATAQTGSPASTPTTPPEPTIACPACGRANPASRNFCHSCGARLRPRPVEPMAHRRRSGSGRDGLYRLISIVLLVAIILVGSFLVTRLTGSSSTASPYPSPTRALVIRLLDG